MDEEAAISSPTSAADSVRRRRPHVFSANNVSPHLSQVKVFRTNFHQSIFFVIPALIGFMQLMHKGEDKNPFATHPTTMGLALCATLVFFLAGSGQLSFPVGRFSAASVARHCMLWSGNAVVSSLASVFAPGSVRPLLYAATVLVSAGELMRWLYNKIRSLIMRENLGADGGDRDTQV